MHAALRESIRLDDDFRHRNVNTLVYVSALCTPGILFSVYIFVIAYRYAIDHSNT